MMTVDLSCLIKTSTPYWHNLKAYGFIRCHQSHLVNRNCIKSWVKTAGEHFLLENGDEIPISRSKKERVAQ